MEPGTPVLEAERGISICQEFYAPVTFLIIKTSSAYVTSKEQVDFQWPFQPIKDTINGHYVLEDGHNLAAQVRSAA